MTDCFQCADPQNMGDVALILKDTAMRAEKCIYDLESRLRQAINPPTIIVDFPTTNALTNIRTPVSPNYNAPLFTNDTYSSISIHNVLAAGMYQVGITCTATATGAVTDNSLRLLEIAVRPALAAPTTPDDYTARYTEYEASQAGGTDMTLTTTIVVNGTQKVAFYFVHTNASSVDLTNGTVWASRISDAYVTRVVQ